MNFDNKVVMITGAARGLGQEYARQFATRGASVVVSDVRDCTETRTVIESEGAKSLAFRTDVTDADSVRKMVEATVEEFGGIDILINNAALYGSLNFVPFDQVDESEWDSTMDVNVKGIWQCCKAAVPSMKTREGGSIVNVSSLAATYGMPNGLHYTASKAGVLGVTRAAAHELAGHGVTVNAVCPGLFETEMVLANVHAWGKSKDEYAASFPVSRLGQPREVADTVAFLVSSNAAYITGASLDINGGDLMM